MSSAADAPKKDETQPTQRKKRLSFGGGVDGHGAPMFSKLEAAKHKHMSDGYDDMKPPDGFVGGMFKRWVTGRSGSNASGAK